jgi:hypothetical protein
MLTSTDVQNEGGAEAAMTDDEFARQIGDLAERWKSLRGSDLELRYDTGKLLNERYDTPDKRQNRGQGVLKDAAAQLGVAESELSRMRRFAHEFESFDDFEQSHPEATTWTDVKAILPKLNQGGTSKTSAPKPSVSRLKGTFTSLTSKLKQAQKSLTADEKKELREAFDGLAEAVKDYLGSGDQVSADSRQPAA